MKRLLLISFLGSALSLFGASDCLIQLEEFPTKYYEAIIKKKYEDAEKEIPDGVLFGVVADIYRDIILQGYQNVLNSNPKVVQRALEIIACLRNPVAGDSSDIKDTADAFNKASADPQNVALWDTDFFLFSKALVCLASGLNIEGFDPNPDMKQRIISNNGLCTTEEQRIAIAAHLAVLVIALSQRYLLMGHETFIVVMQGMDARVKKLIEDAAVQQS